jgi:hypothetical protein
MIVSRHDDELYAQLKESIGTSDGIEVIRERRKFLATIDKEIDRRFKAFGRSFARCPDCQIDGIVLHPHA